MTGLAAALDALDAIDTTALSDDELGSLLVSLRALENRLDAAATRLTGEWDARQAWAADGARNGAAWLAHRTHMPHRTAQRRVRLAREVRAMPAVASAWVAGEIESGHVSALARARNERTAAPFERDEAMLVDHARTMRFDDFTRVLAYWSQVADPDGVEQDARELHEQRHAHLSLTFGGAWAGDLLLDPIGGSIVDTTLREIERELYDADKASDRERTSAQRRADAFVEMATRARTAPRDGRRPAPLFTVLVGYETFAGRVCELANGTAVSPGSLVPWLDEAHVERVVFDGESRVIDVGVHRRLFGGATRRAVEVRDRNRCHHPTCTATSHLQVDHIQPWASGGPTVQRNGQLACGYHNRERHQPRAGPAGPAP